MGKRSEKAAGPLPGAPPRDVSLPAHLGSVQVLASSHPTSTDQVLPAPKDSQPTGLQLAPTVPQSLYSHTGPLSFCLIVHLRTKLSCWVTHRSVFSSLGGSGCHSCFLNPCTQEAVLVSVETLNARALDAQNRGWRQIGTLVPRVQDLLGSAPRPPSKAHHAHCPAPPLCTENLT